MDRVKYFSKTGPESFPPFRRSVLPFFHLGTSGTITERTHLSKMENILLFQQKRHLFPSAAAHGKRKKTSASMANKHYLRSN